MNLWFRLAWTVLAAWLGKRRAGLFDTTVLHLRVLPNDLDFNGHVNNGRYLTLGDLGRIDYVMRTGAAKVALRLRAMPIVGDAVAKFRRDLKPFERFTLHTRLLGWDEKWTYMEHRFVRAGRVVGVVTMRGLFRSATGPIAPSTLLAAMGMEQSSPALPAWALTWSQSCDGLAEAIRAEERTQTA
jgi:acyl-CoA thioesterase FadM